MIKAIETRYKGYRFRSRLEARWAVFFDALNVDWQYEPEGYQLASGWYLPDFYLPDMRLWVEIKPLNVRASKEEHKKMCDLVGMTNLRGTILRGDPYDNSFTEPSDRPGFDDWSGSAIFENGDDGSGAYDCPYCFCVCNDCGRIGFEYDGRGDRVCLSASCKKSHHGDKGYSYDNPRILSAAIKARSARFEHGETP